MKKNILVLINYSYLFYFKIKFFIFLNLLIEHKKIVFIDIDNTIADTWPTIGNKLYKNEFERNLNIPIHQGMRKHIDNNYKHNDYYLVYLTARNYRLIPITHKWLNKHDFTNINSSVVVVSHPKYKLYFIKQAILKKLDKILR
jgi:FMN phosphatase YigB (HAD superfamily)